MISFSCPQCGMKLKVKPEFAGRSSKCPTCKQPLLVPPPSMTQAEVGAGPIDGMDSSLAKAGVDGGVTLEHAARPGEKSVQELLSHRTKKEGRYIIEGEIARGGMGTVLRAVDCDIRREVAVKYLLDQSDPKRKARFVEEAQITGQLEHPNIVPIHELGIDAQQRLFFSMKMVKGCSLAQVLNDLRENSKTADKDYPLSRLLNIFVNVCNALAYAHSCGVVHRDLKPANIMVGGFGEVYVMDWGLAKLQKGRSPKEATHIARLTNPVAGPSPAPAAIPLSGSGSSRSGMVVTSRQPEADLTQEGAVLGTPAYMPPEQATGKIEAIDQRSDVYSLGAILFEVLALQPPVDKEGGYLAVLMRVMQGEIVPPQQRNPARGGKIPKELSAIAMKALAHNPQDRYPNVEALRRDIERFQEGRSVSAKEDTFREMAWKLVKRNKLASAFTTLLAIVLLWGFWVNWLARREAEQANDKVRTRTEKAVPALLEAARLGVERRNFPNALEQVNLALNYAPDNAAARLLKGQLLIVEHDFAGARTEIEHYLRERPQDTDARTLAQLCQKPQPGDEATSLLFARIFNQQQMYGLIDGVLAPYGKTSVEARALLLQRYRQLIEAAWPGRRDRLEINTEGLRLEFSGFTELRDLSPLRSMPLTSLNLKNCTQVQDLAPLRGMLLTSLNLHYCRQVKDLTPLQGMPIQDLNLFGNPLTDLTLVKGMPLTSLDIAYCSELHDLSQLEGMKLETIALTARNISKGMDVLRRMKTLKTIATNVGGGTGPVPYPAAEFWQKYDAGEFTK